MDEEVLDDEFLKYCEELDSKVNVFPAEGTIPTMEEEPLNVPDGNYSFKVVEYVFLTKENLVAMFSLLGGNPVSALIQLDIRDEACKGNLYRNLEEAKKALTNALQVSESNGWKIGWRGARGVG